MIPSGRIEVDIAFNAEEMAEQLSVIDESQWVAHVNRRCYEGEWCSLPLRVQQALVNENPIRQCHSIESGSEWADLPLFSQLKQIKLICESLPLEFKSVRLMKLAPGGKIRPHTDKGLSLENGEARLHIPLTSSEGVRFYSDGKLLPMEVGELWYVNAGLEHAVENTGTENRINLVMDVVANDWLLQQVSSTSTSVNTSPENLTNIINKILDAPTQAGILKPLTDDLADIFAHITGVSSDTDMNLSEDENLSFGVAISPVQAAKCVKEILRTKQFLGGINQAIRDKLKAQQKVRILYAGTGPYGTILLPLLPLFRGTDLKVTLLDIHQENCVAIKRMISWLDIEDFVLDVVCEDATVWRPPNDADAFDIIISETMNTFLKREPQVFIFAHLQQFLTDGGVLIPEQVSLKMSFVLPPESSSKLVSDDNKNLVGNGKSEITFFELNKATARQIFLNGDEVTSGKIQAPDVTGTISGVNLDTDITVYGSFRLGKMECSLNIPVGVRNLAIPGNGFIDFAYIKNPNPDWHFEFPDALTDLPLISYEDCSHTHIPGLARLWDKLRRLVRGKIANDTIADEWQKDNQLLDLLGVRFPDCVQYLSESEPDLENFIAWCNASEVSEEKLNSYLNQTGVPGA